MQAVILAAGKGTRLWPLTAIRPKPLLRFSDTSVLEHNLEQLSSLFKEVILVVGYGGKEIKNFIGEDYKGMKITYAWQKELLGTGDALITAKPFLKDKFLVLNGDDFYFKEDIKCAMEKFPSIMVKEVDDPRVFACVLVKNGEVADIVEKPKEILSNLANIGAYFLDMSVFELELDRSPRGEYEITDFVKHVAKTKKLYHVLAQNWFPGSYPWHLLDANQFLLTKKPGKIEGKIEHGCNVGKQVTIQEGSIIKENTVIEDLVFIGKNCVIGPNVYLGKFSSIGNNCIIKEGVKIKNSIIGDFSTVSRKSELFHSIIGQRCHIGKNCKTKELESNETVKVKIKEMEIDIKRKDFGCVVGDNTKIEDNVSLKSGILIGANCVVKKDSFISKNIEE